LGYEGLAIKVRGKIPEPLGVGPSQLGRLEGGRLPLC